MDLIYWAVIGEPGERAPKGFIYLGPSKDLEGIVFAPYQPLGFATELCFRKIPTGLDRGRFVSFDEVETHRVVEESECHIP